MNEMMGQVKMVGMKQHPDYKVRVSCISDYWFDYCGPLCLCMRTCWRELYRRAFAALQSKKAFIGFTLFCNFLYTTNISYWIIQILHAEHHELRFLIMFANEWKQTFELTRRLIER